MIAELVHTSPEAFFRSALKRRSVEQQLKPLGKLTMYVCRGVTETKQEKAIPRIYQSSEAGFQGQQSSSHTGTSI